LVSTPAFDPNRFTTGLSQQDFRELNNDPDNPLFNRALAGTYPPGSVVKPFLGLAALFYASIEPNGRSMCPGFFMLPGNSHRYRDWRPQGHGLVDMHDAIVQSCDVYYYNLAVELGIDKIEQFLKSFGFGAQTGIGISGERRGVVPSREWKRRNFSRREDQVWFPGETVITGIGQGFTLVTPIQLAHATAVLANRGVGYRPRLVIATENGTTAERVDLEPVGIEPLDIDDSQWQYIHDAMAGVTGEPRGSGFNTMNDAPYSVAGKTGTAQVFSIAQEEKYDAENVSERLRDHGLFIAFAPIDSPSIAVAVVVENGGGGASAAAPVARTLLDAYFMGTEYVTREH
jgi:penicillin-binding protein 2